MAEGTDVRSEDPKAHCCREANPRYTGNAASGAALSVQGSHRLTGVPLPSTVQDSNMLSSLSSNSGWSLASNAYAPQILFRKASLEAEEGLAFLLCLASLGFAAIADGLQADTPGYLCP
eukprot:970456-Amphidinium_carterae.2